MVPLLSIISASKDTKMFPQPKYDAPLVYVPVEWISLQTCFTFTQPLKYVNARFGDLWNVWMWLLLYFILCHFTYAPPKPHSILTPALAFDNVNFIVLWIAKLQHIFRILCLWEINRIAFLCFCCSQLNNVCSPLIANCKKVLQKKYYSHFI